MKRSSLSPEDLLAAGRREPPLRYDVERGFEKHRLVVDAGAPLPGWADGIAARTWFGGAIAKSLVGIALVGGVVGGAIYLRGNAGERALPAVARPAVPAQAPAASSEPGSARAVIAPAAESVEGPIAPPPLASDPPPSAAPMPRERSRRQHELVAAESGREAIGQPAVDVVKADAALEKGARFGQPAVGVTKAEAALGKGARLAEPVVGPAKAEAALGKGARLGQPRNGAEAEPSRAGVPPPSDLDEMRQLAAAERLLTRDPARALALVQAADHRFAAGYFRQERAYVEILALTKLQRAADARARARQFFASYPRSPYRTRIDAALATLAKP